MIRIVAALSCVSVLAGCAFFNSVRENYESRQVLELIGYAQKIAALEAEEQRRELKASSLMLSKERGAYPRGRLALLLPPPGTAFHHGAKAPGLPQPPARPPAPRPPPAPTPPFHPPPHSP